MSAENARAMVRFSQFRDPADYWPAMRATWEEIGQHFAIGWTWFAASGERMYPECGAVYDEVDAPTRVAMARAWNQLMGVLDANGNPLDVVS